MAGYHVKRARIVGSYWRTSQMRGDPGLFGALGKVVGAVAPKLLRAVPGVGTALSLGSLGVSAVKGVRGMMGARQAVSTSTALAPYGLVGAGSQLNAATGGRLLKLAGGGAALAGAGAAGYAGYKALRGAGGGRRYRRMNPLNPKAANRAIRRIKAIRKLTRSIESSLPKRACSAPRRAFGRKR